MQKRMTARTFGVLLLAAFAGGVCSQAIGALVEGRPVEAAEQATAEVRATALVIVGEDGTERARLGAYEGGYGLVVRDTAGVPRAILSLVNEEGVMHNGVALALHDPAGKRRLYMGPGLEGTGFEMVDPRGTKRFSFGEGPDGGGFEIYDPVGTRRFLFGHGGDGGSLQISDPRGNVRLQFGEGDAGGAMQVSGPAGIKRFSVEEGGGAVSVNIFDAMGAKRAGMQMAPDGESDLYVTGGLTEWKASACLQMK